MDAHKRMVVSDILAKENWQYIVPIYQRAYKWTNEEVTRLVKDIVKCGKGTKEHFVGSIVYQLDKNPDLSDLKLYLVDGQQRITTLLLITKALNLLAKEQGDNSDAKYVISKTDKILYIDVDDKERGYKILPSKNDAAVFNAIISATSYEKIENNPLINKTGLIYNAFNSAYQSLQKEIQSGTNIKDVIYNGGMLKISAVEIQLTFDEDAQEIFESINSLGVSLTNADLIRNYLLMSNKNQKTLYNNFWEPIYDQLIGEKNMESFVRNYILMKREYSINEKDVYKEYVRLAEENSVDGVVNRDEMLKDLYEVAQIYEPFIKKTGNYSATTNKLMEELRDMDQSTAYPFLMKVFLDHKYKPEIVNEDTLNKVINLIIIYLVRRTICGVPTHSLRNFMLSLYRRVFKVSANYDCYYEAVCAFLLNVRSNDYLRSEDEVKNALPSAPLYRNTKFATYLLYRMENGRYPKPYTETVSAEDVTIEHIMPQTLTDEWEVMLSTGEKTAEEVHREYLDTLGNLSLSSREKNSVMSNESFKFKKDVLKTKGSKFTLLNQGIVDLKQFTEKEIIDREKWLESLLLPKYDLGDVNIEGIRFEDGVEIVATDEANDIFIGSTPISYKLLGTETSVDTFSRIVVGVTRTLLDKYPETIKSLAEKGYNPWNSSADARKCLYYKEDDSTSDPVVGDNICVLTTFNSNYCVQFCTKLMAECGLDADQLQIYLKKDSIKKENAISKQQKVRIVREVLQELNDEGKIEYNYNELPNSDSWIKFKMSSLNDLFLYDGPPTSWDNGKFQSAYYCEYNMRKHRVVISLKRFKESADLVNKYESLKNQLELEDPDAVTYWHMKSYYIDFEKVINSTNIKSELKKEFERIVDEINQFAEKVKAII